MTRVECRWLLPVRHALIDCFLLWSLVVYADTMFRKEHGQLYRSSVQPALLQEGGSNDWDLAAFPFTS